MTTFNLGFIIGRFQHIHESHVKMIHTALDVCDRVILMVGSSQESGTERNPFNLYTRMNLIRKVFEHEIEEGCLLLAHTDDMTHEGDNSVAWGDFLIKKINMWRAHYGIKYEVDCFIYGNDEERSSWFRPEEIEKVSHIILSRKSDTLSSTSIRRLLVEDYQSSWKFNTPDAIHPFYKEIREELMAIDYYKSQEELLCQK
ncbi:adenylyltransferase/cytidyltransferase family protein [Peribacillus asahii]|uniref:adenylyltransferase/cytidyltransferase family protein n=1 Tax=Peribacillus asahii TaxID=228899 RepID=UPI00382C1877